MNEIGSCRKPRLRLVITSATLDGEKFSTYFGDCPVFSIPGRCFEVAVVHASEVCAPLLTPDGGSFWQLL